MTVKELKEAVCNISSEYDDCELFTDVGSDKFAEVADLVRIAEPKISGYKIPENRFYVSWLLK